ncbi:DUF1345 domain-containing protein [Sphingomonas sp. RS2018]
MDVRHPTIGNRLAPPRFLAFVLVALVSVPVAVSLTGWAAGVMIGFDVATIVFLASVVPLLSDAEAQTMRRAAQRNDANRALMLAIVAATSIAVLVAVATELGADGRPSTVNIMLVVATLALSWLFANMVYALHYAHVFYVRDDDGSDAGGLGFPTCDEPGYWEFVYFAFTLGMTFQTSDVEVQTRELRRIVVAHSLMAFVFNLGIVAFTINVLGGG